MGSGGRPEGGHVEDLGFQTLAERAALAPTLPSRSRNVSGIGENARGEGKRRGVGFGEEVG